MTIQDVARHLGISWDAIKEIQKRDLTRRFSRPGLKNVRRIAIDEISVRKGHRYLTVVLDMDTGVVIFVGDGKGGDALDPFWQRLRRARAKVKAVDMDMSPAYISAVLEHLPKATIVFDHFHVVKLFNDKLSDLRRDLYRETKESLRKTVLKGTRWLLLKNPENLDPDKKEKERLAEALKLNEPLSYAYYLKEDLRQIWLQPSKEIAERVFTDWIKRAHPAWLKAQIFPYDIDLTVADFQKWLADLERIGVIDPFTAAGESFFFIRNFADHQKVDRPSKMRNPPCPRAILDGPSRVSREPLATDSQECSDETETEIQTTTAVTDPDQPPLKEREPEDEADSQAPEAGRRQPKPAARVSSPARKGIVFDYTAGRFDQVSPELVQQWQQAYPAVDVLSELRRMEAWASANPVNRKSNWQRFIVNWLTRAQDRAGRSGPRGGPPEGEGGLDRWLKKSSTTS